MTDTSGSAWLPTQERVNAALLAHAFNVLPEVVEALKLIFGGLMPHEVAEALRDGMDVHLGAGLLKQISDAIDKAEAVEVPE